MQYEDARVPEIVAFRDVFLGRRFVGFLEKGIDGERRALEPFEIAAAADVAVTGMRTGGLDAEQHELARRCHFSGATHGLGEFLRLLDRMIGGHDDDDAVGVLAGDLQGRDRNGGRCVARDRLEHDGLGFDPRLFKLGLH